MNDLSNIIRITKPGEIDGISFISPAEVSFLPPGLTQMFSAFENMHLVWKMVKMFNMTLNQPSHQKEKSTPFLIGIALHEASGQHAVPDKVIQVALISKAACDLMVQYRRVSETYKSLQDILAQRFTIIDLTLIPEESIPEHTIISPSFKKTYDDKIVKIPELSAKTAITSSKLFFEISKTVMLIRDAQLLIQGDSNQHLYACIDLANDWICNSNQDHRIATAIIRNQVIKKFLDFTHLNMTVDTIINEIGGVVKKFDGAKGLFIDLKTAAKEVADNLAGNRHAPVLITFRKPTVVLDNTMSSERYPLWVGQKVELIPTSSRTPFTTPSKKNTTNKVINSAPTLLTTLLTPPKYFPSQEQAIKNLKSAAGNICSITKNLYSSFFAKFLDE